MYGNQLTANYHQNLVFTVPSLKDVIKSAENFLSSCIFQVYKKFLKLNFLKVSKIMKKSSLNFNNSMRKMIQLLITTPDCAQKEFLVIKTKNYQNQISIVKFQKTKILQAKWSSMHEMTLAAIYTDCHSKKTARLQKTKKSIKKQKQN